MSGMQIEARRSEPPIVDGVLFSPLGDVHEWEVTSTLCGMQPITRAVRVTALQVHVHKLRLCGRCYPPYNAHGRAES